MKLLIVFALSFLVLSSCSKQTMLTDKQVVNLVEDKRNISEVDAARIIDRSHSPEEFGSALQRISQFHKLDFSFQTFWKSLRYPLVDVTKVSKKNLEGLGPLGQKSCSPDDSQAYIQYLLYLKQELALEAAETYLKLMSFHLDQCAPKHPVNFYRPLIKEVTALFMSVKTREGLKHSFSIYRHLSAQNEKDLNRELSRLFRQEMVEKVSSLIAGHEDLDLGISFSSLLKDVQPFNQRLSLLPLEKFVGSPELVKGLITKMQFQELETILKRVEEMLPYDGLSIKEFLPLYVAKLENFYAPHLEEEEGKTQYLESLDGVQKIFARYSQDLKDNLDVVNALSKLALDKYNKNSEIDILERRSDRSLVAASVLAQKMDMEQFSAVSLPVGSDKLSRAVLEVFRVKLASDHSDKLRHKQKFCEAVGTVTLDSLVTELPSGCFQLNSDGTTITVKRPLRHSFFSALEIDVEKLVLKAERNHLGIIDLSSNYVHEMAKAGTTPVEHDAVVIPLVLGFQSELKRGIFNRESNYYFFYHLIYQGPLSGPAPDKAALPLNGKRGGDLSIERPNGNIFNFISLGGEGQKASPVLPGGRGHDFKFDEAQFELWVSGFVDYDSYLMVPSLRTVDNLKSLSMVARRSENKLFISYLDPNYLKQLPSIDQSLIEKNISIMNAREGWGCTLSECMLKRAADYAVKEITSLLAVEDYKNLLINMSPSFRLENGSAGPTVSNGKRGNNGKVTIVDRSR